MRAQVRWVMMGDDPRDARCKLATGVNKGRNWPKENREKSREWRRSGFPGPVLWKEQQETRK
jgi:hypothetical protein